MTVEGLRALGAEGRPAGLYELSCLTATGDASGSFARRPRKDPMARWSMPLLAQWMRRTVGMGRPSQPGGSYFLGVVVSAAGAGVVVGVRAGVANHHKAATTITPAMMIPMIRLSILTSAPLFEPPLDCG